MVSVLTGSILEVLHWIRILSPFWGYPMDSWVLMFTWTQSPYAMSSFFPFTLTPNNALYLNSCCVHQHLLRLTTISWFLITKWSLSSLIHMANSSNINLPSSSKIPLRQRTINVALFCLFVCLFVGFWFFNAMINFFRCESLKLVGMTCMITRGRVLTNIPCTIN